MKTKYSLLTLLVVLHVAIGCNKTDGGGPDPKPAYQMEGKWTYKDNSLNTMYIFDGGLRYTYYCTSGNCDSLYSSFEAGDTNALPTTHPYTFMHDTLMVDLHFGNKLISPIKFECNGEKAWVEKGGYYLYRLHSNCP